MTKALLLASAILLSTPVATGAQVWPPYAAAPIDQHRYQADRHRYEMDRLRARSDERAAFARQQQLESRLTLFELEAARRPEPVLPAEPRRLRSPEAERALRESATTRGADATRAVGQIDAWLDRAPR